MFFWSIVLTAIALVLVFESIFPFLSPKLWRKLLLKVIERSDASIRFSGFVCLFFGVALMLVVHTYMID